MKRRYILSLTACLLSVFAAKAQQTSTELELLTVNENITTVITATEPIRFVDISTDMVAGDQPIGNTLRLKPKEGIEVHNDGDMLGVVTIITERYRAQYVLIYTTHQEEAVSDKEIDYYETRAYNNPAVSLSSEEMSQFARRIWNSPARYHNAKSRKHRMTMRLNNIYSVGDYFFIDFSIDNRTNIRFDIDQLRVKLTDKRQTKATNCQTIELFPAFVLDNRTSFKHGYRNVIVLKKLTFPNDKQLRIELTEKQISGRNIAISINYKDVLEADSFDKSLRTRRRK